MAGYWRSLACRAWANAAGALGALPGPVHLNLPFRDPLIPDGAAWTAPETDNSKKRASADLPARDAADTRAGTRDVAGGCPRWRYSRTPTGRTRLPGAPDGGPWTRVSAAAAVVEPLELPWSERGVLVCGDGDYDAAALVELAERAGWPVLAEPSSGARRGPNALTGYQYLLAAPGVHGGAPA